jgi:hypothetical protein
MIELFKWGNGILPSSREIVLLDASLNIIKSIRLSDEGNKTLCWFAGDGFCEIDRVKSSMHDDSEYHIRRYDRYLNLIWESDSDANFIYFFKSTEGDIWAYKSMLFPERECYIEYYGNEWAYTTDHTHNIVFKEKNYVSCFESGIKAYWYCTECGCIYSDSKGENLIIDARELISPSSYAHVYEDWIQIVAPSCETKGTERRDCVNCDYYETRTISATGHTLGEWMTSKMPTCEEKGIERKDCVNCDYYETRTISATGHDWIEKDGYKICGSCGETVDIETPSIDFEKNHSECEGSIFETIINMIINFLRNLLGLPEVCVCGEELY